MLTYLLPAIPYFSFIQFELGPFRVYTWGLMVGLGFLVGIITIVVLANKDKIDIDHVLNLAIYIFIGSFIGARLFYILLFTEEFSADWMEVFRIWNGGMVFYGGLIGALLASYIYIKVKKLKFWEMADVFTPGLAIGIAIGRLGCFFIHDHIGKETSMPWGLSYFEDTVRHEPSMYGVLSALAMFVVFLIIRKKMKFHGQLFVIFTLWYSFARLIFDGFRSTDLPFSDPRFIGLTISQHISIILIIIFAYLWWERDRFLTPKTLSSATKKDD
ncbi:MAG: prolipoprotein diacylglyceryl transferase [bacterium]